MVYRAPPTGCDGCYSRAMSKRRPMSFGKKVAFGLLATLLFFGVAEVGFRVVVSLTSDRLASMIGQYRSQFYSHINQELAYRPHPYFGYVRRDKGDKRQFQK